MYVIVCQFAGKDVKIVAKTFMLVLNDDFSPAVIPSEAAAP